MNSGLASCRTFSRILTSSLLDVPVGVAQAFLPKYFLWTMNTASPFYGQNRWRMG